MKRVILLAICLCIALSSVAQGIDDLIFQDEEKEDTNETLKNDIIKVNFKPKSARRAMLYSALVPGAGQFYADKSAITAYIFPVLEAAMIGGIIYFSAQGSKKEKAFEKYANGEVIEQTFTYNVLGTDYTYTYTGTRYNRAFQNAVQDALMNYNPESFLDIYNSYLFRLDDSNSQHFYEDIGKYNKYIFGWADWFATFAMDPTAENTSSDADVLCILDELDFRDAWVTAGYSTQHPTEFRWVSNQTIQNFLIGEDNPIPPSHPSASPMRQEYIAMRNDSKDQYAYASYFTLGLAMNHLVSAIDAVMLTNKVNRKAITQNPLKLYYYTDIRNSRFTPSMGMNYHF